MTRRAWIVASVDAAVVALIAASWLDPELKSLYLDQARDFTLPTAVMLATAFSMIGVAVAILVLAVLVWQTRSAVVALAYAAVGAFLVFLPAIVWSLAASVNDAPPVIPAPAATVISNLYFQTQGPLGAVELVGGGMLVAGLATLARSVRDRRARRRLSVSRPLAAPAPAP